MEREKFRSRLGFLMVSAGCAIGIGNVWKFPYMVGNSGGGLFVLLYLFFLIIMGVPVLTMEYAIGRSTRKSSAVAFNMLEKPGQKWHVQRYIAIVGNIVIMMFYTTVAGWMLYYFYKIVIGDFASLDAAGVEAAFNQMMGNPGPMAVCTLLVVLLGFAICSLGLKNGVERIGKWMMLALLAIMVVLAARSVFLDGAEEGLKFYLLPSLTKMKDVGFGTVAVSAMNQSFFTLSVGIGGMEIFGSYLDKDRSLVGEAVMVCGLDTFVALVSGLIIFPACFAYNVAPNSGPPLIFITLPNIFNSMAGGRVFGAFFFIFMSFAAFSTVIGVFENIIALTGETFNWDRKKACIINCILIAVLSMPCVLGFNVWSGIQPLKAGNTIMDLEDFIVSNLLLPIGSLITIIFCTSRHGWGWKQFLDEANQGKGMKMANGLRIYCSYVLPLLLAIIIIYGLVTYFA